MNACDQHFHQRISHVGFHGLGLSVDVYSPSVLELVRELDGHQLPFGYLEIFKASTEALHALRQNISCSYFEYHADGLWVTQPDWWDTYPVEQELDHTLRHLQALDCQWINQECASKQMVGYSFGTYLPPLFTKVSAQVTASNARGLQARLDQGRRADSDASPLVLLETPPLTYFACGDISYMEFFREVTAQSACGLVLDIGHLWTVYRYAGYARTQKISDFLEMIIAEFPLHRVVQIHLAGLREHPHISSFEEDGEGMPTWIDAHDAPIPGVLIAMLEQILARGHLPALKGIALEVDTKPIPRILEDYTMFRDTFSAWEDSGNKAGGMDGAETLQAVKESRQREVSEADRRSLLGSYQEFVERRINEAGLYPADSRPLSANDGGLGVYRGCYLPREILEWGGDVREMFPQSCVLLEQLGQDVAGFVDFWLKAPRQPVEPYDFFLLKIRRFVEFVRSEAPAALPIAEGEAETLREGYELANRLSL